MNHDYPHIGDTEFPNLSNVDVYKYENEYDYDLYTDSVTIKMLNVSWCSDYENVVYFESKEERDAWFDAQDGISKVLSSMFRLYNDGTVKVDIPVDECMQYNYVMIDYGKLPQQATASKDSKMFYFISGITQQSVNATELTLSVDYWTCYINDMNIQYVNLYRGHWPMAHTDVDTYLSNPVGNNEYLLTPDVNYGSDRGMSANTKYVVLNDVNDLLLCFATNGGFAMSEDNNANWSGNTYTHAYYPGQQLPSAISVIACAFSYWQTFQVNVEAQCPQFLQTVKGMFIVPRKLLNVSTSTFDFCGVPFYAISGNTNMSLGSVRFGKEDFQYDEKLAGIAKLYTYPYAALEIDDFKGHVMEVRFENTVNDFEVNTVTNLMYPFLNVEAYFTGIGSDTRTAISFYQSAENTFTSGGSFYRFNTKWSIPVFSVQLTAANDWALNGYLNAEAARINSQNSAIVSFYNAYAVANNSLAVADKENWLRDKTTELNNTYIDDTTYNNNQAHWNEANANLLYQRLVYQEGVYMDLWGTLSAGTNGFINSVATGNTTGVVAQVASIPSSIINESVVLANNALLEEGIENKMAANNKRYFGDSRLGQGDDGLDRKNAILSKDLNSDMTTWTNAVIRNGDEGTGITDVTAAMNKLNADRSKALINGGTIGAEDYGVGNAQRSFDYSKAQKYMQNHPQFGQLTGTPEVCDKPWGFNMNVVTQSRAAIRQAAEQFMRYGYMLNMEVDIDSFNIMPNFTYWQCDKVYCNDKGVFGGAQNVIKSILNEGTTVWRDPSKIGVTSIYDNIEVTNE